MKEIDFLPEWYKSGRRRQVSYRTQYIALVGVFAVMTVWSFISKHSISKARAQYTQMATEQAQAQKVSAKMAEYENEMRILRKNAESIEKIDSRIDVASVLAEMSYLIHEKIVLKKVEFIAEKFEDKQEAISAPSAGAVVRVVRANLNEKKNLPLGNVRFKVIIAGVAADASDVAILMCKLEDSPYFRQVVLSFSRGDTEIAIQSESSFRTETDAVDGTVKSKNRVSEAGDRSRIPVNEFEINCYLANYREL
jgi:Tfp pilus assembly protein PilN